MFGKFEVWFDSFYSGMLLFAVLSREAAFQEVTRKVHSGDAAGALSFLLLLFSHSVVSNSL